MLFYNLSIDETLKKLGSNGNGLTVSEVKKIPEEIWRKRYQDPK